MDEAGPLLLPGTTHLVQFDLDDSKGGDCGAFVKYDFFVNLHKFPQL